MNSANWDVRFFKLARTIADWSKDRDARVGAVIVKDNRVISTGFNGFPHGVTDKYYDNKPDKLMRTIHAEANAILFAKTDLTGHTLYCTHHPCAQCAAFIIQTGISRVVCPNSENTDISERWHYEFEVAEEMFGQAGVKLDCIDHSFFMAHRY